MGSTGQRRRPQKYPEELRERAVRMVFEIREQSGEKHGVIARVARELGVGTESLRSWVSQAEVDSGRRAGTSTADAQRIAELERENPAICRSPGAPDRPAWLDRSLVITSIKACPPVGLTTPERFRLKEATSW